MDDYVAFSNKKNDPISLLLIDDDDMVTIMLNHKFKKENYSVTLAQDGNEGKEKLKQGFHYDIIVTDLMMPYVSGIELIYFLRQELKRSTPIIVLSTAGHEDSVLKAFEIGANDFIKKPFSPKELQIRVERLVKQ